MARPLVGMVVVLNLGNLFLVFAHGLFIVNVLAAESKKQSDSDYRALKHRGCCRGLRKDLTAVFVCAADG